MILNLRRKIRKIDSAFSPINTNEMYGHFTTTTTTRIEKPSSEGYFVPKDFSPQVFSFAYFICFNIFRSWL